MTNGQSRREGAWGIVNGDGELLTFTIRPGRDWAIGDFCKNPGYDYPESTDTREKRWRWLKRRGNRCVRVEVYYAATEGKVR
ncbi:MAG TPA: hypothetical protein VK421_06165 [Pyrinomonadaceae bacterium]|nr:hypothetical protein [Pyrinomonadaceae bacterium]